MEPVEAGFRAAVVGAAVNAHKPKSLPFLRGRPRGRKFNLSVVSQLQEIRHNAWRAKHRRDEGAASPLPCERLDQIPDVGASTFTPGLAIARHR